MSLAPDRPSSLSQARQPAGTAVAGSQSRSGLRLVADDLTGALDTAVEFVAALGPVQVAWGQVPADIGDTLGFDVATREGNETDARDRVAGIAAATGFSASACAYLKLDSLLRGHAGAEIATLWSAGGFDAAVIAPAFPYQGRITAGGRQRVTTRAMREPVGEDLVASLNALGLPVRRRRPGTSVSSGIAIWDASSDEDLDVIVDAALKAEAAGRRILWCGSGGLAGALARRRFGTAAPDAFSPAGPILGLFGTDHPVTHDQLMQAGDAAIRLVDGSPMSAEHVREQLGTVGAALVAFDLAPMSRRQAQRRIAAEMAALTGRLDPPATLVCGGGETLRGLADALGATALDVVGRIVPGVPVARLRGGRWDGVPIISKSGAFGDPDFLKRLVAPSLRSTSGALPPYAEGHD